MATNCEAWKTLFCSTRWKKFHPQGFHSTKQLGENVSICQIELQETKIFNKNREKSAKMFEMDRSQLKLGKNTLNITRR